MAVTSTREILQGVTSLEVLRARTSRKSSSPDQYDLVCIPQAAGQAVIVASALATERMYDLGWACNWRNFMAKPLIVSALPRSVPVFPAEVIYVSEFMHSSYIWLKLNPTMLKRMRLSNLQFQPPTINRSPTREPSLKSINILVDYNHTSRRNVPLLPHPTAGHVPALSPDKQAPFQISVPSDPDHCVHGTSVKLPDSAP